MEREYSKRLRSEVSPTIDQSVKASRFEGPIDIVMDQQGNGGASNDELSSDPTDPFEKLWNRINKRIDECESSMSSRICKVEDSICNVKESMAQSLDSAFKSVDLLRSKCENLEGKLTEYSKKMEVQDLKISKLETKNSDLNEKLIRLECHARRENLLFTNIEEHRHESDADCLNTVQRIIGDIGLDASQIEIDRCHRKGQYVQGEKRPIIAKFHNFGDRQRVFLGRFKLNKSLNNGNNSIYINEDFPFEVEQRRKLLYPIRNEAKKYGQRFRVKIVVDKIMVNSQIYTVDTLCNLPREINPYELCRKETETFYFFSGRFSAFSNFHSAPLTIDGMHFNCSEQAFQYRKCKVFNDQISADKVMGTDSPSQQKRFGKSPQGFNRNKWEDIAPEIMKEILVAKFTQNPVLGQALKDTGEKEIVEANRHDTMWGVGLGLSSKELMIKDKWNGENRLGIALGLVREMLKSFSQHTAG